MPIVIIGQNPRKHKPKGPNQNQKANSLAKFLDRNKKKRIRNREENKGSRQGVGGAWMDFVMREQTFVLVALRAS